MPGQMDAAQRIAAAQMRATAGLLEPEEIKAIRQNVGLTQPTFEILLGVGPKTAVRWERGTVFQNAATDKLLRLVRDVPGAAEYLATQHGVRLRRPSTGIDSPSAASEPSWLAEFNMAQATTLLTPFGVASSADDPKIVSIESYRSKRSLSPIPPELLRQARL